MRKCWGGDGGDGSSGGSWTQRHHANKCSERHLTSPVEWKSVTSSNQISLIGIAIIFDRILELSSWKMLPGFLAREMRYTYYNNIFLSSLGKAKAIWSNFWRKKVLFMVWPGSGHVLNFHPNHDSWIFTKRALFFPVPFHLNEHKIIANNELNYQLSQFPLSMIQNLVRMRASRYDPFVRKTVPGCSFCIVL